MELSTAIMWNAVMVVAPQCLAWYILMRKN